MSCLMTKPTKWSVCLPKTQISLGIRPIWSESSHCTQFVAEDPMFLHADSEERADAQADLSLHWVHMSFCWVCHEVAQISLGLITVNIIMDRQFQANSADSDLIRLLKEHSDLGIHCLPQTYQFLWWLQLISICHCCNYSNKGPWGTAVYKSFTHISIVSLFWDLGKQCRPSLHCLLTENCIKNKIKIEQCTRHP